MGCFLPKKLFSFVNNLIVSRKFTKVPTDNSLEDTIEFIQSKQKSYLKEFGNMMVNYYLLLLGYITKTKSIL